MAVLTFYESILFKATLISFYLSIEKQVTGTGDPARNLSCYRQGFLRAGEKTILEKTAKDDHGEAGGIGGGIRVIYLAILLLLAGCVGKLPGTVALTGVQEQKASALLQQIREHRCPDFLDADVTINWHGYGQRRNLNATLQATREGAFRLSGLDPLGRPFFILVTDGTRFTLVDNRRGRGYTGPVDSAFLRNYFPVGLQPTTCFSFLAAQLPDENIPPVRLAGTDGDMTFWVVFALEEGKTQQAEINPSTGNLLRQLLVDSKNSILLEVRYDQYLPGTTNCAVPAQLTVEGRDLTGSLQIRIDKLYPGTRLPAGIFHLQVPQHFTVTEVN